MASSSNFAEAAALLPAVPAKPASETLVLTWRNVSYTIAIKGQKGKQKHLKNVVDGVSGGVESGKMVAILGSSGSGKTSLLNAIARRAPASAEVAGAVAVNGRDVGSLPALWWRRAVGFAEQEDVLLKNLTVRETLYYQAALRLPSMSYEAVVDGLLAEIGLSGIAHSRIGDPESGGISGGEKKRLSIAIEIITNPTILFADEPTSGLDAASALSIVQLLKRLAVHKGIAVLITIHQPRETILDLFDRIMLLSGGKVVWFGTAQAGIDHFAQRGFPLPERTNPGDHFLDLLHAAETPRLVEAWRATAGAYMPSKGPNDTISNSVSSSDPLDAELRQFARPAWQNFVLLVQRHGKDKYRDRSLLPAIVGNIASMAVLLGFMFFRLGFSQAAVQSRFGLLLFFLMNAAFGSAMPLLGNFASAKRLIIRERRSGSYGIGSRFAAELVVNLPISFLGPFITGILIYWMTELNPAADRFGIFVLVVALNTLSWLSVGLFVGSLISNVQIAQMVFPLIAALAMLFSGGIVNTLSIPMALRWIQWLSITRYSYTALMINEFNGEVFSCEQGACQFPTGEDVISFFNLRSPSISVCILVLLGVFIGMVLLANAGLHLATATPQKRLKKAGVEGSKEGV